jgi:hypothetical protein
MMRLCTWLAAAGVLALSSAACEAPKPVASGPVEPSPELEKRAVLALLPGLQFGSDPAQHAYREIRAADVAGAHFVPSTDRWVVHYCVEYLSFASDAPARRCDLSVEVYQLDTKKWIGLAHGAGTLYRWQVLDDAAPVSGAKPASDARSEGGAKPQGAP